MAISMLKQAQSDENRSMVGEIAMASLTSQFSWFTVTSRAAESLLMEDLGRTGPIQSGNPTSYIGRALCENVPSKQEHSRRYF